MDEIMHYLPDQKNLAASQIVTTVWIVPKISQGQPQHFAHTVLDIIQIGSL